MFEWKIFMHTLEPNILRAMQTTKIGDAYNNFSISWKFVKFIKNEIKPRCLSMNEICLFVCFVCLYVCHIEMSQTMMPLAMLLLPLEILRWWQGVVS